MLYRALQTVNIRREPRITTTNRVGRIDAGTVREVYETIVDRNNWTWGRVSDYDNHGVAQWMCIRNVNTIFMTPVESGPDQAIEARVAAIEARVAAIEAWARGQGMR